jgi:hypothetical protein
VAVDLGSGTEYEDRALSLADPSSDDEAPGPPSHLPAFMLGTVIGALAGALLGTLVSPHTRAYLVGLYQLVSRRISSAERDKLRFELLLQ